MVLGELLRELRGSRRVAEVADAIGVAKSAVYLWESKSGARRLPTADKLQRLLDLYEATADQRLAVWTARARIATTAPPEPEPSPPRLPSWKDRIVRKIA